MAQLAARLGVSPAKLDVTQPVTRYGLDSLLAVELLHSVETELGIALPVSSLLQGSSIRDLATEAFAQSSRAARRQ